MQCLAAVQESVRIVPLRKRGVLLRGMKRRRATEMDSAEVRNAREAVDAGLVALEKRKDPDAALQLFRRALEMQPDEKEASAAAYNIACCYVAKEEWDRAADQIVVAVNDFRLDSAIPEKDPDLGPLRGRPEWERALGEMKGGMTTSMKYNMISELRSPFRFFRFYLFGGLSVGAALGLVFVVATLIKAIQDGESVQEPLKNLAINATALTVLSVLFYRDLQARERQKEKIEREEALSTLQVEKSPGVSLPLSKLRGTYRLVVVSGSKSFCRRAIDAARPTFAALKERGVAVIPVVTADVDRALQALKDDFQSTSTSSGFADLKPETTKSRSRWELKPMQTEQWKEWLSEQKQFSGMTERDFYLQIQLDGSVRASGAGMPPWDKIVSDLPPLDDIRTKLTDNIGM